MLAQNPNFQIAPKLSVMQEDMNKYITFSKYAAVYLLGFITNFSGVLDNISSIPSSYKELKKVYFYSGDHLAGKWSNNDEYILGAGELGLEYGQPKIVMQIGANEHDEISGEIFSEAICEALPLTWVISAESPEPGIFSLFSNRKIYIKQLRDNRMETVAVMEIESLDSRKGVIHLQRKQDPLQILPEKVTLARNLPAFDEDFKQLSEFCAGSPKRFREKLKNLK